jgi:hypothetical protein
LLLGGSLTAGTALLAKKIKLEEDKGVSWIQGCGAEPNRKKYWTLLQSFSALISMHHKQVTWLQTRHSNLHEQSVARRHRGVCDK